MEADYNNYIENNYINLSIKEKIELWKNIVLNCPYRIQDQFGRWNCLYFEDGVGVCSPENCPLFNAVVKHEQKDEREEEFYNCVVMQMAVIP